MPSSTSSPRRTTVCGIDELPAGARREVAVGGEHGVMVFNLGGDLCAIRNKCPHKGGPLGRGRVRPRVGSSGVSEWTYAREGDGLKCPDHQWEVDIRTGQALDDARLRAKTYRVAVEDGQVVLYMRSVP